MCVALHTCNSVKEKKKKTLSVGNILTIQFGGGLFEEFLCSGAHFSRHKEDMRLSLGTNIFHQMIVVLGPLFLLSMRRDKNGDVFVSYFHRALRTLSLFLPAEPVLLSVLVVSARSVWLSSLQTAPAFQFPPSFSQPQPGSPAFALFLNAVFAGNKNKNSEIDPNFDSRSALVTASEVYNTCLL